MLMTVFEILILVCGFGIAILGMIGMLLILHLNALERKMQEKEKTE